MPKLCICQICNCGRHRCPHKPYVSGGHEPCKLSEYTDKFPRHPMIRTEGCKPRQEAYQSTGPLEDLTTNRTDYVKHAAEKPFTRRVDTYQRPTGDIDLTTNYARDFTTKSVAPAQGTKPAAQYTMPSIQFDANPTYQSDYRKWELPKQGVVGGREAYVPPTQPFDADTNYRRDFKRQNGAPSMSCKPPEKANLSAGPFDDLTNYRQDFTKHTIGAREMKEKAPYQPNTAPFDGVITNRQDFTAKQAAPQASCKPPVAAYQSTAPFDDVTTFKSDFKKWPAERPFVPEAQTYTRPQGEMDMGTNYQRDFTQKNIAPAVAKKADYTRAQQGPFEGMPTYRSDYRPWEIGQRERGAAKETYTPNNQPFEGVSNYKTDYQKHSVKPVTAVRPDQGPYTSGAPFDDNTMYRNDFTRKEVQMCPAALLDTGASEWKYRSQNEKGHKFYRPVGEQSSVIAVS